MGASGAPRALLFGAGAVGLGVAASLADAGWDLCLVAPERSAAPLRERGFSRRGLFKPVSVAPGAVAVCSSLAEAPAGPYDCILVASKAFSNAAAARDLSLRPELLAPGGAVVLFQNGWGVEAPFLAVLDAERVYNARVITGFSRPDPTVSEVTVHSAPLLVGSLHGAPLDPILPLAAAIAAGGLPCEPCPEIEKALLAKLLYNCALNPLGAILGVSYGDLVDSPSSRRIMDRVMDEIFAVIDAAGRSTYWRNAENYRSDFYGKLLPPTRAHRSSTLQDVEARRRTEIEFLSGAVVSWGQKVGVSAPTNENLYDLVSSIEVRIGVIR